MIAGLLIIAAFIGLLCAVDRALALFFPDDGPAE